MYLQEAVKDGPARFAIQGLTRTSESYEEATCMQYRGRGSCKERQRQGDSPSLYAATHHYRALNACSKDWFIRNAVDSDTAGENGRKDTIKVGGV